MAQKTLSPLESMTDSNRDAAKAKVTSMRPYGATNLWQGIVTGLGLFKEEQSDTRRFPALMVLTDGMPNYMSVLALITCCAT
jgi:Mg-chelatase subunit ChlD